MRRCLLEVEDWKVRQQRGEVIPLMKIVWGGTTAQCKLVGAVYDEEVVSRTVWFK